MREEYDFTDSYRGAIVGSNKERISIHLDRDILGFLTQAAGLMHQRPTYPPHRMQTSHIQTFTALQTPRLRGKRGTKAISVKEHTAWLAFSPAFCVAAAGTEFDYAPAATP